MEICNSKQECTGCGACKNVCPINCINMELDEEGFIVPVVDGSKCINCGKCKNVCPSNTSKKLNNSDEEIKAYSYMNNNETILKKSSSGGAFSAIAERVIAQGGMVFGAVYDKNYDVIHIGVENIEDLNDLRGSKYVESDTRDTYLEVKECLESGREVLYTGTPCQIAGLYALLGNEVYSNLYTIDVLCHGVPSVSLFRSYRNDLERKYGKIIDYTFRDKTKWGWGHWGSFIYVDSKDKKHKKYFPVANDYFYSLFFKECDFRECCYACKYARIPRIGDVTIGDCWGIEEIDPHVDVKKGVSLILINNEKGEKLVDSSIENVFLTELDINDVIKYNKTIIQSAFRPDSRDSFYMDVNRYGFENAAKLYCKLKKFTPIIARYLPRKLKRRIKKWLRR